MVNLSRILKSLAVEHSLAVVVGFCICCFACFCRMAAQMNLAGCQIPVFFLFCLIFHGPYYFSLNTSTSSFFVFNC